MITLTTEQAQQIEEVLEELCGSIDFYNKYGPDWTHKDGTESFNVSVLLDRADDISKAIIALREALDHSGETNEMVVGWDRVKPEAIASDPLYQQGFVDGVEEGRNQGAEQEEQEPVAYLHQWIEYRPFGATVVGEPMQNVTPDSTPFDESDTVTPLYVAPIHTKDLTDEELLKIWQAQVPASNRVYEFARAVIAAYKEKNK